MDKIFNYQASFFGEFSSLKSDEENIQRFLKTLEGFMFMPVPMTSIDIRTNKLIVDNRMQFISPDKKYSITILPERIDFTYNLNNSDSIEEDFFKIQKEILNYISLLNSILSDKRGNRLANSTVFSLREFSNRQELNEFIKKFSNKNRFYEDRDDIIEWQVRYNSKQEIIFNNKVENSNCIINLTIPNNPPMNNTVLMTLDINTEPRLNTSRFILTDLLGYIQKATSMFIELVKKAENE